LKVEGKAPDHCSDQNQQFALILSVERTIHA
jgi:hypothetical protein